MALVPGTRLGAYEIVGLIGAGGMGEVYRAVDSRLDRQVALKVLPEAVATDPERTARFQREAKVLASLNHPHIAALFGLEEAGGRHFLTMELVEGETLADRIARGPVPVDEALPIAGQIAEALEAAHEQGIIHRDLKPANIKIRTDGKVKVLDFGLAKAFTGESGSSSSLALANSPTLTSPGMTGVGVILGTAAYMAPEQAKGRPVDARADVWAFGVVLFEMLSGCRAFDGEDTTEVLGAVVRLEPDWKALPPDVPPRIRQLIRACVQKPVKQRIAHMQDVRLTLEGLFDIQSEAAGLERIAPPLRLWQRPIPLIVAAVALLGIGGVSALMLMRPGVASLPVAVVSVPVPEGRDFSFTGRHVIAISPDGARIAYTAEQSLWLRPLDQPEATLVKGTEAEARSPFFSPDGRWVGFYAGNQLKKVAVTGGTPATICNAAVPFGASWAANDTILFGQQDGIWQVAAIGGRAERIIDTGPGEQAHGPQRLPDSDWVLFTLRSANGLWDDAQIVIQSLATGTRQVLIEKGRDARYLSTGHIVYGRAGVVHAVRFDLRSRRLIGGAVPIVEGVRMAPEQTTGAVQFAVADAGTLAYLPGPVGSSADARTLIWLTLTGQEERTSVPARAYASISLSPDETRAAVEIADASSDVWVADFSRGNLLKLTSDAAFDGGPLWNQSGDKVYFTSLRAGRPELYARAADSTGIDERIARFDDTVTGVWARGWAPDGRLLVQILRNGPNWDIGLVSTDGSDKLQPLLQSQSSEMHPIVSPNGRWLAYISNETGLFELYIQRFPELGQKRLLSTGAPSTSPTWTRTGNALLYLSAARPGPPDSIMQVAIEGPNEGKRERILDFSYFGQPNGTRFYDLSRRDDRLLVVSGRPSNVVSSDNITVVFNWTEELKRRVPTN